MRKFAFISEINEKKTLWCYGDCNRDRKLFFDFIQYVLDGCSNPEVFSIYDPDTKIWYDFMGIAKNYGMRKRTFQERMNNIKTYVL